jgi:Ca-activated chloride channel family protein
MSFIWPIMLVLLLLVPLAVVLYLRLQQRRQRAIARYGSLGLMPGALGRQIGARRHLPPALFLVGLTFMLIGMARPQAVVSLPRAEGTVILAFDVSGSMAAEDLQPTRMEAAKAVAREFVQRQPRTIQVGVVAFSESGLTVQAPTNEQEDVIATINRLSPQRGTSLGQGILSALNTIALEDEPPPSLYTNLTPGPAATPTPVPQGTYTSAVVVLLTDGENNVAPDPLAAAQAAADRGVRIFTVGIGSAAGIPLHVNGFNVFTRLDEPTLQAIAQISGGAYYNAVNQDDLRAIYENLDLQLVIKPEEMEVTALFAGVGVLALLIGGFLSLLWFSRLP